MSPSIGVLVLDVASGNIRQIAPSQRSSDLDVLWQLGVAAGHLCASVCRLDSVELYRLVAGDEWKLLDAIYGCHLGEDTHPLPLRFKSDHLKVLLRIGGRVVALEIVHGTDREVRLEGTILLERDEAIVPWCREMSSVQV